MILLIYKKEDDYKWLIQRKKKPSPSPELLEALKEGETIIKEIKEGKRKGYQNVNEMMTEIMKDN